MNAQSSRRARQQERRHRRDRVAGVLVVLLGVVVAVVAILALREPNGHKNKAGTDNPTSSISQSRPSATPTKAKPTSGTSSTRTTPSSPTTHTSGGSSTDAKSTPLVVLNDTTTSMLATNAATRFRSGGWTVTSATNLPSNVSDIISTCAYYDPDTTGSKAAAEALQAQYPTIQRVEPKFDGLPAGPVVVVLTPDYSSG